MIADPQSQITLNSLPKIEISATLASCAGRIRKTNKGATAVISMRQVWLLRRLLHEIFMWRPCIEKAEPTYKMVHGFVPLRMIYGRTIIDTVFRAEPSSSRRIPIAPSADVAAPVVWLQRRCDSSHSVVFWSCARRSACAEQQLRASMPVESTKVWITWERQRRSLELASRLGCDLRLMESRAWYLLRALALGCRTLGVLFGRPQVVYVQNPSIVLAAIAVWFRTLLGYVVVVDRHSNFKMHTADSKLPKWQVFHALSRYTVRRADLTIVTNQTLAGRVRDWGGRPFVLPDPLPHLPYARRRELPEPTVVCVSSFGRDEPTEEVLAAAALLGDAVCIVITGNDAKLPESVKAKAPPNVRFSGFIAEEEFQELLASCDVVLALTTQPNTLVCAAYEAVSLGKPMILSDQEDLLNYFVRGRVPTSNDRQSIKHAIEIAIAEKDRLAAESRQLAAELEKSWSVQFAELNRIVTGLSDRG